jgi:LmbE family N-acetylglucosaminyl deacetylase
MAAGKLGAHLTLLQYPDTHMVAADLIGVIEDAVKALRPDLVLVPSARDSHQDHRAVHAAALSATRAATCTLLAYMSASAAERVRPNWFVPLTEKQMALKLESIACHHSQVARPYMTEEHVRSMGRYWAMVERSAAPYVEPFELVRYRAPC